MKRHGHNAPLRKAKGKDADTSQCQRGLVVSTHGRHVIVVVLGCHPSRIWAESENLLKWALGDAA